MKTIEINELKSIQLEILKNVAEFCDEHQIRWMLAYGTLLGAVRHKGYIPWDDDIDIMMPRQDYEKFFCLYNKQKNVYKAEEHSINKKYILPFGKVHDTRTVLKEIRYNNIEMGIYIDIFPIDGSLPNIKMIKRVDYLKKMIIAKYANWGGNRNFINNVKLLLAKIIRLFISDEKLFKELREICTINNYDNSSYVGYTADSLVLEKIPKSALQSVIDAPFEGLNFKIPLGYHEVLTVFYGDYMKLPPVEKRKQQHYFVAYWKS